jgi:hypothetical protein
MLGNNLPVPCLPLSWYIEPYNRDREGREKNGKRGGGGRGGERERDL